MHIEGIAKVNQSSFALFLNLLTKNKKAQTKI